MDDCEVEEDKEKIRKREEKREGVREEEREGVRERLWLGVKKSTRRI